MAQESSYVVTLSAVVFFTFYFQSPVAEIICNLVSYTLIGALLHIAEDGICGKVPILSTKKKHGLKLFKVGSFGEYVCTGLIVCACVAFSFSDVLNEEYQLQEKFSQFENITTFERLKEIFRSV